IQCPLYEVIYGGCSFSKRKTPASTNVVATQKTTQLTAEEAAEQRQRKEALEYHQRIGTRFTQTHNFD
uniref:Secreted protein n=1 Tax=Parascaris univalens TaxID=6257 RepID=A0A915AR08_PARUN